MPLYEVRNNRSKMVVAEVVVEKPEDVIHAVLAETGSSLEDLALSLGGNMEEVRAGLDIVEKVTEEPYKPVAAHRIAKVLPPRRMLYS